MRKLFVLLFIVLAMFVTACSNNVEQYEFPISRLDIEKELGEQGLKWSIKKISAVNEKRNLITLTNDDNTIFSIGTMFDENGKIINMTWFFPNNITEEKFNSFYNNELPELFKLVGIFYGNKKEVDKGLNELLNYYHDEPNYENGIYWTRRIGSNHFKAKITPFKPINNNEYRVGTLSVLNGKSYENNMRIILKARKEINSIEINECTVSKITKFEHPEDNEIAMNYFLVKGSLKDIKKTKEVPESLKNSNRSFIMPNRDKYLSAKLVDDTGSIDVFLQSTSLNNNELKVEREHYAIMFYYENSPVLIIINSALIIDEESTIFKYKITPQDEGWKAFKTHDEMVQACRIPKEILKKMTTEEVVDAVVDFPLFLDLFLYNSDEEGIKALLENSDAFKELITRKDYKKILQNKISYFEERNIAEESIFIKAIKILLQE